MNKINKTGLAAVVAIGSLISGCGVQHEIPLKTESPRTVSPFSLEREVLNLARFAKQCGAVIPNKTCEPEVAVGGCVGYSLSTKRLPGDYSGSDEVGYGKGDRMDFMYVDGEEGSAPNGELDPKSDWVLIGGSDINDFGEEGDAGWGYPVELGLKHHDGRYGIDPENVQRDIRIIKANLNLTPYCEDLLRVAFD